MNAALKISVLSSGSLLLDGNPAHFSQLEPALETLKAANGCVWYYRESASSEPPPEAVQALQLIVQHKLPITFSSKPDFSDFVDLKGVPHPRPDLDDLFSRVRKVAAGDHGARGLVIVRPDCKYLSMPPLTHSPALQKISAAMERLLPSAVKRNIAVIANTAISEPDAASVNKSIPFLGVLIGLVYIGHSVWIFDGDASAVEAGCRDADALIVDSELRRTLVSGWEETARRIMRNANILVYDRKTSNLMLIRQPGESRASLEFLIN
jgi:hypothetical protein